MSSFTIRNLVRQTKSLFAYHRQKPLERFLMLIIPGFGPGTISGGKWSDDIGLYDIERGS
jgi:hypothetical protein